MRCTNCQAEIPQDSKTCPVCGSPQNRQEASQKNPGGGASGPPRKKGVLIGAGAVVLCLAAGTAFFVLAKDPKEEVIGAFESLYDEDHVNPLEEIFGFSQLAENGAVSAMEGGLTLTLSETTIPDMELLYGSGLRIEGKNDPEQENSWVNFGLIYNNMDLANLDLYGDKEQLAVALPELSDRVFSLRLGEDLGERIDASPVIGPAVRDMGIKAQELGDYMNELLEMDENGELKEMTLPELMEHYREGCEAQDQLKEALTVEKGEKQTFMVNGKEEKCAGYHTYVSKDSLISFLRTSADFFLNDQELRDIYLQQMEMTVRMGQLMGQAMYEGQDAQTLVDDSYAQAQEQVDQAIAYLEQHMGDLDMMVYVSSDGTMAALNGTMNFTAEDGAQRETTFHMEFQGGSYPTQNMKGSIAVADSENTSEITFERQGVYDQQQLTDSASLTLSGGDTAAMTLDYSAAYEIEGGSCSLEAGIENNGVRAVMSASGVVDQLEKGTSFHMTIDEITFRGNDPDTDLLQLSGEIYCGPLEGEIQIPEGEILDVLEASQEEWNQIGQEMYGNVFAIVMQLM